MSPTHFQLTDHHHQNSNVKRESNQLSSSSSSLKINKDSHMIKKSSPSSSSSSSSSLLNGVASVATKPQTQPRHPVIIYTHSPKIIHTHPKDFMALVQKLTGLSRSEDDQSNNPLPLQQQQPPKSEGNNYEFNEENSKINGNRGVISDDNESTSVVTDENNSGISDPQVNSSCYVPSPIFDPPNPCFSNGIPFFNPNSTDFLCSSQPPPFYNYSDSSLFYMPNMRSSFSSSSLEGMKELPDF